MEINTEIKNRIDEDKLNDAFMAADFLSENFVQNGRFKAKEAWGPEGLLYLAESSWALLSVFEINPKALYTDAVKAILEELKKSQKASGGWALELGVSGVGFKVSDEVRRITAEIEDLPPTVAVLKTIANYQLLTGDASFYQMGEKAFTYLLDYWDNDYGSFLEKENNELMALRSNPRSYHLFSFEGILAWQKLAPAKTDLMLPKLLDFIKTTFESYDEKTMPLVYGLHAAILLENTTQEYIKNVIKPRIDSHLINNKVFKIQDVKGGYGHHDGSRGIVTQEVHMRSCAGIAIAAKFYDIFTNTRTYQDTEEYKNIAKWIQGMKSSNFYYEYELLPERKKIGYGSPGQYLSIWWILGKI